MRVALVLISWLAAVACGDDGSAPPPDSGPDAMADSGPDATDADVPGADATPGTGDHRLDCDPNDTWLALDAASAGRPALRSLGDADPASPTEVGDGRHHLFVGVAHEDVSVSSDCGEQRFVVLLHEATSDTIDRGYVVSPEPLVSETILYDRYGMETPTYFRADERTEYIYYCAIYNSYSCRDTTGIKGKLMALRRVDGGAWERVMHDVAPFSPGSTSQCEPEIAFDPESGLYHLFFIADDGPDSGGLFLRTSADPERFPPPPEREERLIVRLAARPTAAWDPYDEVWRFTFDAYDGNEIFHVWSETLAPPDADTIAARTDLVHEARHDLHPEIHANADDSVGQAVSAVFPDPTQVLFFYTGIDAAGTYRVHAQRCTRR